MFGYYNKYLDSATFKLKGVHKYVEFRFILPDMDVLGLKEMLLLNGWSSIEPELSIFGSVQFVASRSLESYLSHTVPSIKCDVVFT